MAKTKADWLKEAKALGLKLTPKDKIADIKASIAAADSKPKTVSSGERETKSEEPVDRTPNSDLPTSKTAKAGKRSKKALEEAEVKAAKEARKRGPDAEPTEAEPAPVIKRGPRPVTRPKIERRGKKYQTASAKLDKTKAYSLKDGLKLALETSTAKFDATVELHVRLNVDPKQADQNIRETVDLPSGAGKTARVAVFADSEDQAKALSAGADLVGEKDLLDQLAKDQIDFDVLIATPQLMGQLGRFAKTLGPKGLMPNPKSGTVTKNVASAVKQAKAGRVELRIDKQGIIHLGIGKVSFKEDKLLANITAVLSAIKSAKPASVKGAYLASAHLSTTMGPSVKLDTAELFTSLKSEPESA